MPCTCSRLPQNIAVSSTVASIKTSPLVLNQAKKVIKTEPSVAYESLIKPLTSKQMVSTKYETFHRRKCYFNHARLDNNYKKVSYVQPPVPSAYFKSRLDPAQNSYISLTKTIRIGGSSSSGSNIAGASLLNQAKSSSNLSSKMGPGMPLAGPTKVIKLSAGKDSENEFLSALRVRPARDEADDDEEEFNCSEEQCDPELDQEASSDNILIDLEDIEQVVKNCDDYFEEASATNIAATNNNNNIGDENGGEFADSTEPSNSNGLYERNSKLELI